MSEEALPASDTAIPRWIAGVLILVVGLASLAALVWPSIPFTRTGTGPGDVGVIGTQVDEPGAAGRIGALAPNFEWTATDGKLIRLSDLRGKVVVINFWATWCVPCREEMPALNRLARSSPDIVFLEVDLQESGEKVRSFVDQLALEHLVPLLDPDGNTTRRYGVLSLPWTFFVDREGIIRHMEIGGPLSEERVKQGIEKAS
jgi:thiol-disulfide isomerase/thioredoxin